MASHHYPITISTMVFALTLSSAAAAAAENSASNDARTSLATSFYDILKANALPIGLFPKDIAEFSVDPTSGRFELHLLCPSPCEAKFETHVRYEWNITGVLSYGKLANLSGMATQELFLWLPVKRIQVDIPSSGLIYFDVGVVSKQFSLSFFETPKDCNAMTGNGGRDYDVVLFDDNRGRGRGRGQGVENHSEELVMEQFKDEERRAVA